MTRYCLIGPTYPYRGGIAHYTTLLAQQLSQMAEHDLLLISFSQQYPSWLFPGRSDKDPSKRPLTVPAEYLLNPLNPFSWWRTLRRIRQWQPDVVVIPWWHPYFTPVWTTVSQLLRRSKPAPTLLFICHNVFPHESSWFDRLALKVTLSASDGYLVHAQSDADKLRSVFPKADIRVNPLPTYQAIGAETAVRQSQTAVSLSLPTDKPLLLFMGFVRDYKGLDTLLAALPHVQTPIHLLVAGEFWQGEAAYQEQIDALGIANNVTLLNKYLPDEELTACLSQANVVVLPYRSATQSAVVQLAFGHGVPVITTNVGGLAEAVTDEQTGLVVPPEDPYALAEGINRYFDEDLEEMFRQNIEVENSRWQNGRFSWQQLINQLEALHKPS